MKKRRAIGDGSNKTSLRMPLSVKDGWVGGERGVKGMCGEHSQICSGGRRGAKREEWGVGERANGTSGEGRGSCGSR